MRISRAELNKINEVLDKFPDVNGIELARSVAAETIVVDQTQINNPTQAAQIAAPILNLDQVKLTSDLTGKLRYKIIAKNIAPASWLQLQKAISTYNKNLGTGVKALQNAINGFYSQR